jgi:hypothetical protein
MMFGNARTMLWKGGNISTRTTSILGTTLRHCSGASIDTEWHQYQKWHLGFQEISVPTYDDKVMPLNQIASISTQPDGSFKVLPWDPASTGRSIRQQLHERAGLGLNVLSGTDDQIFLVLSAEEEAVLQEKVTLAEKNENEYTTKAHQKREKKTKRQTSRLQIHEILDTFAWSELPIAAQNFYLDLGWSQV